MTSKTIENTTGDAGTCVFCGAAGVTKEHTWSDWLNQVVPVAEVRTQITIHEYPDQLMPGEHSTLEASQRNDCRDQWKLRNVCEQCFDGWMSEIMDHAKPYASQMMQQQSVRLDREAQTNLAAWIAMVAIMGEFTDVESSGIPPADRAAVFETKTAPACWTISFGRYSGEKWSPLRYRHQGCSFFKPPFPDPSMARRREPDQLHVSTIAFGPLFAHALSTTHSPVVSVYRRYVSLRPELVQLWPLACDVIEWPDSPVLGDIEMKAIADNFYFSFLRTHGV